MLFRSEHDEDEVYFYDLLDCSVVDENNVMLGVISEVIDSPAHAIIRVKREGKDLLIPYVDTFIVDENMDDKIITVRLIEGML